MMSLRSEGSRIKLMQMINLRRLLIFLVITCGILLILNAFLRPKITTELIDPYDQSALILRTSGCEIPKLDPYDPSVIHLIVHKKPYTCRGMPVFMITHQNATITLNETQLNLSYNVSSKNVSCLYNVFYRESEPEGYIGEDLISMGPKKELQFGVPLGEKFIKVQCSLGKRKFTQYIPLVPIKPHVEKGKTEPETADFLNVVLIGIDSVSKLNFLRHFKKTHKFLINNFSAFDMKGYTKVGDNTFPNIVPMLTGHFIEHYWNETLADTMFFDNLDFIWKAYSKKGYRTFYAEENPYTATFNFLKRGFKYPPTDYYFRTLALAMRNSKLKKRGKPYCYNSKLGIEIVYGYLKDFLVTMKDKLNFSFILVSSLTHNYINRAGYADEPTYNLLKDMKTLGVMNRSLVVIFSDHGIRFGKIRETYIGKFEERMPFMYLTMPKWFLEKHKTVARNLKTNENRLISLFDIHATLEHLLKLPELISEEIKPITTGNGLSLMGEIPEHRTCEMANILPHWCPCQIYQNIPLNDTFALIAANAIIYEINKQLKPFKHRCKLLKIGEITDAMYGQVNDVVLRFVDHVNDVINRYIIYGDEGNVLSDFLITLRADPGGGMFEGTVRYDSSDESMNVLGISRINAYGTQSWCVNQQSLKKYCYCK